MSASAMISFALPFIALVAAVLVEIVLPDRAIYHDGWYNVVLAALIVLVALRARDAARMPKPKGYNAALLACALGAGVIGTAGIANGLLGPDPATLVGAPGQQMSLPDLGGSLLFPPRGSIEGPALMRPGGSPFPIGRRRYTGSFVLRTVARTVVSVDAYDANGAHLTITQPTGAAFLSPVLLMQQTQRISGLDLPYDSFALPAAHRIVKVVLFSAQQVAAMRGIPGPPQPAVLFAVDDETDRPLPGAIRLARSAQTIAVGGVRLRATVISYPAVDVIATPSLAAVAIGMLTLIAGLVTLYRIRTPSRW